MTTWDEYLAGLKIYPSDDVEVLPDGRYLPVVRGRRNGKTSATQRADRDALARGEHVHSANAEHGERCLGGDPECPIWARSALASS